MSRYVIAGGQRRMLGVMLSELLISIAVLTVLIALAAPAAWSLLNESRRSSRVGDLIAALAMARNEAVKRNIRVTLCKSVDAGADTPACDELAGWHQHWILFVDNNLEPGNQLGVIDGGDQILYRFIYPDTPGFALDGGVNFARAISYLGTGRSQGIRLGGAFGVSNGTFTFCLDGNGGALLVNRQGRVRRTTQDCV